MSNVKISALPPGTALVDTDTIPVVRAGVTTAVNTGSLVATVASQGTSITTLQNSVQTLTPLDQSAWAWYNQGSATVSQSGNIVGFTSDSTPAEDLHGRIVNQPATPYTITAFLTLGPIDPGAYNGFGIGFSDGTKAEVISYVSAAVSEGPKISITKQTNPTTNSARSQTARFLIAAPGVWLRLTNDGATMTMKYSFDGVNFILGISEAVGTFLTPTKVGVFIQNFSGAFVMAGAVRSWVAS